MCNLTTSSKCTTRTLMETPSEAKNKNEEVLELVRAARCRGASSSNKQTSA